MDQRITGQSRFGKLGRPLRAAHERPRVLRGRGATANPPSRYLGRVTESVDDGWSDLLDREPDAPPAPETRFAPDRTITIISSNDSPDVPFDRSINPFKGCEHGCVYCFARPTHAYLDLSPGLDFETRILFKTGVRARLLEELSHPRYRCATLAMGTNTDPYQPVERSRRVTRAVLEVLHECRHPVSIVTKSQLILRDLDLLSEMAAQRLASVAISVTTLDRDLKTVLEPRTADGAARLRVIRALADAGIPTRVMVAPVIPFLNDHELENILAHAAASGARQAGYILLRLPGEVAILFRDWLEVHYPDRADRVMRTMAGAHGGKTYDARFGQRQRGSGPVAELLAQRFARACRAHGLAVGGSEPLRTDLFRPPGPQQGRLF